MTRRFARFAAAALAAAIAALPSAAAAQDDEASSSPLSSVTGEYRLGAGDKLRVEVYKDPQLSQSVQVQPDGKITLPLVGDVVAVGRTPMELRDELTESLREYITNPVVTVIVVEALASQASSDGVRRTLRSVGEAVRGQEKEVADLDED